MKLYFSPGACSLSPHIALEEAGLKYETESVDLAKKVTEFGSDYWKVNSKGSVPALVLDNGELLTEGPAIVQYIADQAPQKKLAPANGTLERYRLQGWLNFIATDLHRNFTAFLSPAGKNAPDWQAIARANLEKRLAHVDAELAGKNYLLGDDFSVADGYLFTMLSWAGLIKLDLAQWSNLAAYFDRVKSRPAVQAVLKAEGLA